RRAVRNPLRLVASFGVRSRRAGLANLLLRGVRGRGCGFDYRVVVRICISTATPVGVQPVKSERIGHRSSRRGQVIGAGFRMDDTADEIHLTKLERVLAVGLVACLLLATWELCHLLADTWLYSWVSQNRFVHRRIIYYGVAFVIALPVVLLTATTAFAVGRFGATLVRALLWYGVVLLITAIAVFVFDCLPEVVAGICGAIVF